ncbi:MAG TPA: hypothetical protein VGK39_04445, partial [Cyclobacteriaceae bacterium]
VLITVSGTSDNSIDLSKIGSGLNTVLIERVSGTSVQFNTVGAVAVASGAINATQTKLVLPMPKLGDYLYCKGGAGSETFYLTAV